VPYDIPDLLSEDRTSAKERRRNSDGKKVDQTPHSASTTKSLDGESGQTANVDDSPPFRGLVALYTRRRHMVRRCLSRRPFAGTRACTCGNLATRASHHRWTKSFVDCEPWMQVSITRAIPKGQSDFRRMEKRMINAPTWSTIALGAHTVLPAVGTVASAPRSEMGKDKRR
jgi:hypothetical protein